MITFSIFTELEKLSAVFGNQVNYQSLSGGGFLSSFCQLTKLYDPWQRLYCFLLIFRAWVWSWSRKYSFFWPPSLCDTSFHVRVCWVRDWHWAPCQHRAMSRGANIPELSNSAQCVTSDGWHWPGWWLSSDIQITVYGQCQAKYWSVIVSEAPMSPVQGPPFLGQESPTHRHEISPAHGSALPYTIVLGWESVRGGGCQE